MTEIDRKYCWARIIAAVEDDDIDHAADFIAEIASDENAFPAAFQMLRELVESLPDAIHDGWLTTQRRDLAADMLATMGFDDPLTCP